MCKHNLITPKKNKLRIIFTLGFFLLLILNFYTPVLADQGPGWSPPLRIPGFSEETNTPILIADQNRTVHAFVSDWVGDENPQLGINYTQWNQEYGWSSPVDIIMPARGQARLKGAFLDQTGMMHLVFFGGDEAGAQIYYTRASAAEAGNVRSWSNPIIVGEKALIPDEADIGGDGNGNLFIIFAGYADGHSLYAIYSNDGGDTWSLPEPIFLTNSQERWPTSLYIYVDQLGGGYALWSVADKTGNSLAVYFSKQNPDLMTWSEPIQLAQAIGFEADTPTIIKYNDELLVIYHNDKPTTHWMRRSKDDGVTWTPAVRLFPHVGANGPASTVIDSGNTMHMLFGQRVDPHPATHGMWHSTWVGGSWTYPEGIDTGLKSDAFDPSFPHAVVSQGNTILVAWRHDPGSINGIWYSYTNLDSPELPLIPLPTPPAPISATQTPASDHGLPAPTSINNSGLVTQDFEPIKNLTASQPYMPLVLGALPIIILLVIIIIIKGQHR
ncbi:sialidase family protein [Chloroflexota bacterium]